MKIIIAGAYDIGIYLATLTSPSLMKTKNDWIEWAQKPTSYRCKHRLAA